VDKKAAIYCCGSVASFTSSWGFALLTYWSARQGGWFWAATSIYSLILAFFFGLLAMMHMTVSIARMVDAKQVDKTIEKAREAIGGALDAHGGGEG
jgi:hypothetical protein